MTITGQIDTNTDEQVKEISKIWINALAEFGTKNSSEDLISNKEFLEKAKENIKKNRSSIIGLWETFTVERDDLSKALLSKKEAAFAYLAGFHLGNVARTLATIKRADERHPDLADKTKGKHIHIFDIACGTGASSIALAKSFKRNFTRSFTFYLTDASASLLDIATHQIADLSPASKIISQRKMIEDIQIENFAPQNGLNIYSLGYIWNELKNNQKAKQKLEKIFQLIAKSDQPCLIQISEPANEQQARGAMELRNNLCDTGLEVLYPCSHLNLCPLLESGRDWCYSEFSWERPYLQKFVDTMMDVKRTNLGSSSFLFANKALDVKAGTPETKVIVGKPKISKDKDLGIQLILCGEEGTSKSPAIKGKTSILKGEIYNPRSK